jgi:Protein of unknown function (DUF1579)
MFAEPQAEHQWLQQLAGDWTTEAECAMGPDQPPTKTTPAHDPARFRR